MSERVAVVGSGIVGLAHALAAAKRGHEVRVFERNDRPRGASIRNFGMVWPIGLPPGFWLDTALLSRQTWLDILTPRNAWAQTLGSLFVATNATELRVMEQFVESGAGEPLGVTLLDPDAACARSPLLRKDAIAGAMHSPTEVGIQPAEALRALIDTLRDDHAVRFDFNTAVVSTANAEVRTGAGETWPADRVVIASGADFETLYPREYTALALKRCKLQMLKVPAIPNSPVGPLIASGLTLRHYPAFNACPAIQDLRDEVHAREPDLDRFGIHVMAAQHADAIVLGDSHDYDDPLSPFDSGRVETLMLQELRRFLDLPDWTPAARWHGVYAKKPGEQYILTEPEQGVWLAAAVGGLGMTLSIGAAERAWRGELNPSATSPTLA